MDVSVIIPARDAAGTLGACLAALAAQETGASFEVIVVDDGSRDATSQIAGRAGVRVVAGRGEGPAAARNLGAGQASGEVLAFVDADCFPEPGWLEALVACASRADLIQGPVAPPADATPGPFDRLISVQRAHGLYETANLAIRRELFERLGGFESILQPRSGIELGEDVWLGWRARRTGARDVFCEDAVVRHAVFARTAAGYVAERVRLQHFPEMVSLIPELRDVFCHRRYFLNARSARFDLALAGVAVAALARNPLPLAAALPYVRTALRDARGWPRPGRVLAAQAAADAVGAAALAYGSLRSRTLLL